MPTYSFLCAHCGEIHDSVMPMRQYIANPPRPHHCGAPMQRHFTHAPGLALVGESHYDGLRAPDGADISTRAKHRAYMRDHQLTTVDDFKSTWAKQERERALRMAGADSTRAGDIAQAIDKLGG